MTASIPARAIWFVVFPGFELLDLGGPLCAFTLASDFHAAGYVVHIVSATGGLVAGAAWVTIATVAPPALHHLDTLVVVGAQSPERCCQSDSNLSPFDALRAELSIRQAASDCHSASAAERRSR